jgi:hypothetical protein
MTRMFAAVFVALGLLIASQGCSKPMARLQVVQGSPAVPAELWQDPIDLAKRDLFHGAGGSRLAPKDAEFTFVAKDTSGWSPGFDVKDQQGIEWSVKLGPEAQSEVLASRVLWAIGFHQPPTYYLEMWNLKGLESGRQPPGRFRPDLPSMKNVADWSWYENPFVGSRAYGGLIVTHLILNSWDWKTSNNKIYELAEPVNGVSRWFVVRDLGASLGKTHYPRLLKWFRLRGFGQGSRNDIDDFEQQGFIKRVATDQTVDFDYRGIYRDVINSVTTEDVRWACELLSRLTPQQWNDAFRAAGYNPDQTSRYVSKIRAKVAQGLAVAARPPNP